MQAWVRRYERLAWVNVAMHGHTAGIFSVCGDIVELEALSFAYALMQ